MSAHPPYVGLRRILARGLALVWTVAAIWVGVLLLIYLTVWRASGPPPGPETAYVGLIATVYPLLGLYGGVALVLASAFGPDES